MKLVFGIKIPVGLAKTMQFHQWVDTWNNCEDIHSALGLLHNIYSANEGETFYEWSGKNFDEERHLFLLNLADGHRAGDLEGQPPAIIREKAFQVLAQHFFKPECRPNSIRGLSKELTGALLSFFAVTGNGNVFWLEVQPGHADTLASKFMKEFFRVHWEKDNLEMRLKILEILHARGRLRTIFPQNSPPEGTNWYWRFDDDICAKLHELALRDAPSIEEGVAFANSDAAILYTLARMAHTVAERRKKAGALKAAISANEAELSQLHS